MKRHLLLLSIITLLVLTTMSLTPVFAQDNAFVYLYDSQQQSLLRVALDGTQTQFDLGLDANTFIGGRDIAFTSDGSRAAFCAIRSVPEQQTSETILFIRDLAGGSNLVEQSLGQTIGCSTNPRALSDDQTRLAVGLTNYFAADPQADTSQPIWQLFVFDLTTGQVMQELNSDSPALANFDVTGRFSVLPYVRDFSGSQIVFSTLPLGTETPPDLPAYVWNMADGSVTQESSQRWGQINVDTLDATGETVWVAINPDLPAGNPGGPIGAYNAVMLTDQSGQERMIYHDPEWLTLDAVFINNGRQIAISLLESFNLDNPTSQRSRWIALDRSGNVTEFGTFESYSEIAAAPDGYLMLQSEVSEDFSKLTMSLDYHANDQVTQLWSLTGENRGITWDLAWATPTETASDLPPFETFTP